MNVIHVPNYSYDPIANLNIEEEADYEKYC